jgi:hypothetical protein
VAATWNRLQIGQLIGSGLRYWLQTPCGKLQKKQLKTVT